MATWLRQEVGRCWDHLVSTTIFWRLYTGGVVTEYMQELGPSKRTIGAEKFFEISRRCIQNRCRCRTDADTA